MRKIIIKLPDERVKKFRIQRPGWKGRRFGTAAGLLNRLSKSFPRKELQEKTAIVVKQGKIYKGRYKGMIVNESLPSSDPLYLVYTTACFLEDHVSREVMRPIERKYIKYA